MKTFSNILFLLLISLLVGSACQEIIDLELESDGPKLVVEGRFTNFVGEHFVKLSESVDYYNNDSQKIVTDAQVILTDSSGNFISTFAFDEERKRYVSNENLSGKVGETYRIQIDYNDEVYEATGKIRQNGTLDSLFYLSDKQLEAIGTPTFEEGYYVLVNGTIEKFELRHFRLKVYENDTLKSGRGDYFLFDTETLNDRFTGFIAPGVYDEGDTVKLELYAIMPDMYDYYLDLVNLLFNDGGVFSPPPVNPRSNVTNITNPDNQPLGYMEFSSVIQKEVIIEEN